MKKCLKKAFVILIAFVLLCPITKVLAAFDNGDSTIFMRVPEGHGCYHIGTATEDDDACGTKRFFVSGGTEVTLRATPEEGYHLVGWFPFTEVDDGQGNMSYPIADEPLSIEAEYKFTAQENGYKNIAPVFAEGIALEEIRITGELELEGLEEGELPAYTVQTTTEHVSIEAYGNNTTWAKMPNGTMEWVGFGNETPTAAADRTFYAMKLAIHVDDGYVIKPNTKIFYNNRDMYDTFTNIQPEEWGGYVYVDFGQVNDGHNDQEPTTAVEGNNIVSVALNVDLPRIGDKVTVTEAETLSQEPQAIVHIGDEDPYRLREGQYMYYFSTETGTFFNGTFEKGKTYRIHIWLDPREPFSFVDNVDAHVNGNRANFLRDENGYIVEYDFEPEEPDAEYTVESADGSAIAIFNFPDGHHFELNIVDILKLTPEQIEEQYGVPAEYIEQAVATIKENVKKYGDLLNVYSITIDDAGMSYSGEVTLKIKITEEMKKYNSFKFIFLDENDEFKVKEVHDVEIDGDYLIVHLDHLSAYALVGENITNESSNPATGDKIIFYLSMLTICISGFVCSAIYTKKKYFRKTVKQD